MKKPDLVINDAGGDKPYLSRWYIIPRNPVFNVYLHRFERSDDDRALHDHPWYSFSFLLRGEMLEHSFKGARLIPWLWPVFRTAKFAHRLELVKGPVWTVFITGPRIREWGFYCYRFENGQWMDRVTKKKAGRTLDGVIWDQYPGVPKGG